MPSMRESKTPPPSHNPLSVMRRLASESGASAIEFALVFSFVLVPLMMGLIEYGWYFYTSQVTASAARDTARRLSVGDCTASGKAQAFARAQANFKDLTLTFGTTTTQNNTLPAVGSTVRVEATQNATLFTVFPLPNNGVATKSIDALVEDDTEDTPC